MLRGVSLLIVQDAALELGLVGLESTKERGEKKKKNSRRMVGMDKSAQGLCPKRDMSESSHRD